MRDLFKPTTGLTSLWIAEGNMGEDVGKPNFFEMSPAGYEEYAAQLMNIDPAATFLSESFNAGMPSSELFTSADPHTLGASMTNQTKTEHRHQYPRPETGSSSNLANVYPPRPASEGCKTNNPKSSITEEKAARKRALDRQYRERQRRRNMQMNSKLETLAEENVRLKMQNESLNKDNFSLNQASQSQTKMMDQLQTDYDKLKLKYKKQSAVVQTLSENLACPDLRLENQKLRLEIEQLRQNGNMDSTISEVLKENGKLQLQIRVLRVQNDALCGKMINIRDDKNHEAEQEA